MMMNILVYSVVTMLVAGGFIGAMVKIFTCGSPKAKLENRMNTKRFESVLSESALKSMRKEKEEQAIIPEKTKKQKSSMNHMVVAP